MHYYHNEKILNEKILTQGVAKMFRPYPLGKVTTYCSSYLCSVTVAFPTLATPKAKLHLISRKNALPIERPKNDDLVQI